MLNPSEGKIITLTLRGPKYARVNEELQEVQRKRLKYSQQTEEQFLEEQKRKAEIRQAEFQNELNYIVEVCEIALIKSMSKLESKAYSTLLEQNTNDKQLERSWN